MDSPTRILSLVERVRRRIWQVATLRLLGRGLYTMGALAALAALLGLWASTHPGPAGFGHFRTTWPLWLALLAGTVVLTATALTAVHRRPTAAAAARIADREAEADELLMTAWEIAVRGELRNGAERILLARAESARGGWESRVPAREPGSNPFSLIPPLLLLAATLPVLVLSATRGQDPSATPSSTAAPADTPGARLAAAIAQLEVAPALDPRPGEGPAAPNSADAHADRPPRRPDLHQRTDSTPGGKRTLPPASNADAPPSQFDASAPPTATSPPLDPSTDQGGQGSAAAGSAGAGTQARRPLPLDDERPGAPASPPAPAMPPGVLSAEPLTRAGAALAEPTGPGAVLATAVPPATAAAVPAYAPAAAAPAPRWDPRLGMARRALLARYWSRLKEPLDP